jgi:hypothetical protein
VGDRLFEEVIKTINDWTPKAKYSTEKKYRDDLLEFLQKNLNNCESGVTSSPIWGFDPWMHHLIKKEAGRSLADIGIDDEIGIELKRNLKRKSQINRLVGQIVDYLSGYSYVIIVLCGQTDKKAANILKYNLRRIGRSSSSLFGQEKLIRIVSKNKPQKTRKTRKQLALV